MQLLKCPRCKNMMKYQSKDASLMGKKKRCVYCNHNFPVSWSVVETNEQK